MMTIERFHEVRRARGCPWDAPDTWFTSPVLWMAWRCQKPFRVSVRTRLKATRTQRDATYQRDGYRCLLCGSDKALTVDHIVPVVFGGNNHRDNLRTVCSPCNGAHFKEHHAALLAAAVDAPEAAAA